MSIAVLTLCDSTSQYSIALIILFFAEEIRLLGLNLNCPEEELSDDFGNCVRLFKESKLTLMVEKTICMGKILKRFF